MTKHYYSTWYKVTDQILLEYRSRSKDVIFDHTSEDTQPRSFYIYKGYDDKLYYTEELRYTNPAEANKSWFLNQSLYNKYPANDNGSYNWLDPADVMIDEVMKYQSSELIDYSTTVLNTAVNSDADSTYPHVKFRSNFFYDSIRVYFISGYSLDNFDGMTLKVHSSALHETFIDENVFKSQDEVYILDAYIDKSMLYPKKYMGIQSVSPLHLLDIPMLMNSKFYDKYIEIEFPSLYGIGVRDHNVYDEDGNPQTSNDPTFVIIYFNEDGTVNTSQSDLYTVNLDGNTIIEFNTVGESVSKTFKVGEDDIKGLNFSTDPNPVEGCITDVPNSEYFNARIYADSENGEIIYLPVYGDNEFDTEVYGQFMSGELRLDANGFYDTELAYGKFNDTDTGDDSLYYHDKQTERKAKLSIFCELLIDYVYYDLDGSVRVYEDSYSREIDYEKNYQSGVAFWRNRYRPDAAIIEATGASKISLKFTCHLRNILRGSETIRTASLLIDAAPYTSNQLTNLNINTYKIINKIQGPTQEVAVASAEPQKERYIRSYYNATNLVAKNVGTGATVYNQGQMTLRLNRTGNIYGLQLFNINSDNVRVPYDLTGVYKYKLVLSSTDGGTISIKPNQDTDRNKMSIGQMFFFISADNAKAVMDVPADKRYFAITTDLSGSATSQETVLYEGKVDWLS